MLGLCRAQTPGGGNGLSDLLDMVCTGSWHAPTAVAQSSTASSGALIDQAVPIRSHKVRSSFLDLTQALPCASDAAQMQLPVPRAVHRRRLYAPSLLDVTAGASGAVPEIVPSMQPTCHRRSATHASSFLADLPAATTTSTGSPGSATPSSGATRHVHADLQLQAQPSTHRCMASQVHVALRRIATMFKKEDKGDKGGGGSGLGGAYTWCTADWFHWSMCSTLVFTVIPGVLALLWWILKSVYNTIFPPPPPDRSCSF